MADTKIQRDIMIVENQDCPVCFKKTAVFSEYEIEDAYAGSIACFTIKCNDCGFKNSDLEFLNPGTPAEYSVDIETQEDLNIRIIKSGDCELKIPNLRISVESTMNSEGFISNIEGVILRFKRQVNFLKNSDLDKTARKRIKTVLKRIDEVLKSERKITLKLIDKSGNSAIISDKVKIKKLKKTKKN